MNSFLKAVAIVAVAIVVGISSSGPARAAGIDTAAIVAAIQALGTLVVQQVFNPLNLNLMKTSAQATFQSEKLIATIAETARAQTANQAQVQLQRDAAKIKEDMKLTPYACQTLASADAQQKAEDGAREMKEDLMKSLEERAKSTKNSLASAFELNSEIVALEKKGTPVNAATLLGPNTYSPTQAVAAKALIKSLTNPSPLEPLPAGVAPDSPTAKAYEAAMTAQRKQLGLAEHSLSTIYAARGEQPGAGKSAGLANPNASQNEILQAEVNKRSMNADYKKTIMTAYTSPLPVLKEIAITMGTDLQLQQRQLAALERMEALTAAHYAMAVREKAEADLRRQRDAAMKAQAQNSGRG